MKKLILMCLFSLTASALDSSGAPSLSEEDVKELDLVQSLLCALSKTAYSDLQDHFDTVAGIYAGKCFLADRAPTSYPAPKNRLRFHHYKSTPSGDCLQPMLEYWGVIAGPALVASYDSLFLMQQLGFDDPLLARLLSANICSIWADLFLNCLGGVNVVDHELNNDELTEHRQFRVLYMLHEDGSVADQKCNEDKAIAQPKYSNKKYEPLFNELPLPKYWPCITQIVYQFANMQGSEAFAKSDMLSTVVFTQLVRINEVLLTQERNRSVSLLKYAKEITPAIQQSIDTLNARLELQNKVVSKLVEGHGETKNLPTFFTPLQVKYEELVQEESNGGFSWLKSILPAFLQPHEAGSSHKFYDLLQSMENPSMLERNIAAEIVKELSEEERGLCTQLWDLGDLESREVFEYVIVQ